MLRRAQLLLHMFIPRDTMMEPFDIAFHSRLTLLLPLQRCLRLLQYHFVGLKYPASSINTSMTFRRIFPLLLLQRALRLFKRLRRQIPLLRAYSSISFACHAHLRLKITPASSQASLVGPKLPRRRLVPLLLFQRRRNKIHSFSHQE